MKSSKSTDKKAPISKNTLVSTKTEEISNKDLLSVLDEINSKVSLIHAEKSSNKSGGKNVDPDQEKSNKQENQEDPIHNLFFNCKTIDDITDTFHDFSYDKDSGVVSCNICEDDKCTFKYVEDYFDDPMPDVENVQSNKFRSLKQSLKRHIKSQVHTNKLIKLEKDDQTSKQLHICR